jgi:hypothetical protein
MKLEPPDAVILSHPRSGTHFLLSSLASHPKIHGRGEFIRRYQRGQRTDSDPPVFSNLADHMNIAIVMYVQAARFERLCCPFSNCKIIHLLRNPRDVAVSLLQMQVNKERLGSAFRAHYRVHDPPLENAPIDEAAVENRGQLVRNIQQVYIDLFKSHRDLLTISYDEITNNAQVNTFPEPIAARLLAFLGLSYAPLTTTLRKTGPATV